MFLSKVIVRVKVNYRQTCLATNTEAQLWNDYVSMENNELLGNKIKKDFESYKVWKEWKQENTKRE